VTGVQTCALPICQFAGHRRARKDEPSREALPYATEDPQHADPVLIEGIAAHVEQERFALRAFLLRLERGRDRLADDTNTAFRDPDKFHDVPRCRTTDGDDAPRGGEISRYPVDHPSGQRTQRRAAKSAAHLQMWNEIMDRRHDGGPESEPDGQARAGVEYVYDVHRSSSEATTDATPGPAHPRLHSLRKTRGHRRRQCKVEPLYGEVEGGRRMLDSGLNEIRIPAHASRVMARRCVDEENTEGACPRHRDFVGSQRRPASATPTKNAVKVMMSRSP